MPIPINNAQMKSLIDQTFNQKYGQANTIDPVIEGNFLKDFVDFNASQFALLSSVSNIDNTSDANKPVSTAQAAADAVVLASAQAYADNMVVGLLNDRGNYDASVNLFPSTGGSGTSGAIKKGNLWIISVAGTLGGSAVAPGDTIRALINTPGQTAANWAIAETNFGFVPANVANNLSDLSSASTARNNLGLGTLATLSSVAIAQGGVGFTTYTTGDMIYASSTNVLSKLAAGSNGQVLSMVDGSPAWTTISASSIQFSSLSAASASNTINNGNHSQVWQWNSLSGTGLKLTNSFTGAQSGSILLEVENTGTLGTSQNTTALKVTNTKSSSGGNSIGIDIIVAGGTANGINITNSASIGAGINFTGTIAGGGIQMNSNTLWFNSNTQGIGRDVNTFYFMSGTQRLYFEGSHTTALAISNSRNSGGNLMTLLKPSGTINAIGFWCDFFSGGYRSETTSNNTIRSTGGSLIFTGNTGLAGGYSGFTPTDIMTVYGTNSNVGILTTTPAASAALEITSTNKGLLIPRMTGLQAESISSPATMLLVAITTGNGSTITSTGFWYFDGATWIKL